VLAVLTAASTADVEDEVTNTEASSSTTTRTMKTPVSSASQLAHSETRQQGSTRVSFQDENLESVIHYEVPSQQDSEETVLSKWDIEPDGAEQLREQTLHELRDLRNADTKPPDHDPSMD